MATTNQNDFNELIKWADNNNISNSLFPRSKKSLSKIEKLNLSYLGLTSIPQSIKVLQNLKELFLAGNNLVSLPLEVFSLKKLEQLWLVDNYLHTIPNELNNLTNLKELMLCSNFLDKLPNINKLKKLEFIAIQDNSFSKVYLEKTISEISKKNILCSYVNQKKDFNVYIEPLSFHNLYEAELLRDSIFKDIDKKEKPLLKASLDYKKYADVYKQNDMRSSIYWVLKDRKSSKIIGLTGLYTEVEDEENECWLGWFCVDEKYRGKKYGKELFDFTIQKAISKDKNILHIYTYDSKKYQPAICMYKNNGFKPYSVKNTKYKKDLYFKKELL